jgi:LPS-assembly protein
MTTSVTTAIGTVLAFSLLLSQAYTPQVHADNVGENVLENGVENTVESEARSAAEVDWVPAKDLSEVQRQSLPWYCDGRYIQPAHIEGSRLPDPSEPINVSAQDALLVTDHSSTFVGDVELQQGSRTIKSSFISLDDATEIATLQGPVSIREPGLLLLGEETVGNLFSGTGVVDSATFLLHQSGMRGRADKIHKQAGNRLLIENGDFTRCDPGENSWSIHGDTIHLLTEEGYGVARNVTMKIKDVPIAYFPYFRFPIGDDRLSGFLMPGFGHDSDGGTDIVIPYYFNLAPDYDATYTFRSLWKRGLIHDGEFRYLTKRTNNLINAAFIHDDDIYDDRTEFDLTTGGIIPEFKKQNRWLLHTTHSGAISKNWSTKISYSAVSDTDYLQDIGGDVGSIATDKATDNIDASLGKNTIPALNRIASINYRGEKWNSALIVQGFQVIDPFAPEQYEKLPSLISSYRDNYKELMVDVKFDYTYFDKDNEDLVGPLATFGQRAVLDATIDAPFRNRWGFITPSLNLIHRKYDLNDEPLAARSSPDLTTPAFSLDSGLIFDRFFSAMGRDFQQTLEPRLYFLYVDFDEQDDLPQFDATASTPSYSQLFRKNRFAGYDRIGDAKQLSVGLSTSFLFAETGAEFLKASIGQVYYFQDREVIFRPKPADDPTAGSSALFTELRMTLGPQLSMTSSLEWEPREGRTNRGKLSLKYNPDPRRIFNVSYTYTSPEVEQLLRGKISNSEESDLSFIWPIAGKWSSIGRWNFGWDENQTMESLIGLEYNDCCWKFRIAYRRYLKDPRLITVTVDDPSSPGGEMNVSILQQRSDSGIFFEVQLKGLANLGGRLDRLLEDSIPGYRAREERIGL